ncbi:complex I subunit 5 family protein [Otoolea muris]|uniref:complex I subunit 5 family protein n=1 Tax=Otoolea muris TaxID=2941515 RepID=UPI00203FAC41|nr:proton-conducting transporter membrane subunit [Otoolea muris]
MEGQILLLFPVVFPILAGILVLAGRRLCTDKRLASLTTAAVLLLQLGLVFAAVVKGGSLTLWKLTDTISLTLRVDGISRLFAVLTSGVWLLAAVYSVSYLSHEERVSRFCGFYLIVEGVLTGLDFAADLITMYVFFEMMTLTSLPLVLHEQTREAVRAGMKYLFYSVAGAFLALFGIFFLAGVSGGTTFAPGGILTDAALSGREGLLLAASFCMILGFGVKAGMFPLHGWLPTAHPVAPAPASAVLSGLITKSGVLAIIRTVYYVIGADRIRGSWVQYVWILLSLLTVFMGSMLAYKEPVMKKRLAYSTVSQVSYILFGLSLLQPAAFVGALSHIVFHSLIKNALFFIAGAIIVITGKTRVSDMRRLGRFMPLTLGCYTIVSLALVGIPPASGFISKWYLAAGALASDTGAFRVIGPVTLLLSALLTAGYLLPLTVSGFFPGADSAAEEEITGCEPSMWMLGPIALLTAGSLVFGCFPGPLLTALASIAASVL